MLRVVNECESWGKDDYRGHICLSAEIAALYLAELAADDEAERCVELVAGRTVPLWFLVEFDKLNKLHKLRVTSESRKLLASSRNLVIHMVGYVRFLNDALEELGSPFRIETREHVTASIGLFDVDHIMPKNPGGGDAASNFMLLPLNINRSLQDALPDDERKDKMNGVGWRVQPPESPPPTWPLDCPPPLTRFDSNHTAGGARRRSFTASSRSWWKSCSRKHLHAAATAAVPRDSRSRLLLTSSGGTRAPALRRALRWVDRRRRRRRWRLGRPPTAVAGHWLGSSHCQAPAAAGAARRGHRDRSRHSGTAALKRRGVQTPAAARRAAVSVMR